MNQSIRIVLADDHTLFRSGIMSLLQEDKEILIVGQAENGQELINKYFELKPDVIISDISMPHVTGLEAVRQIREKDQEAKALFLSMHEGEEYIFRCLRAGAMGLVSKNVLQGELVYAVRSIFKGRRYFGAGWTDEKLDELFERLKDSPLTDEPLENRGLSPKEMDVFRLIGEGKTSSEIAKLMGTSKRTIDTHRVHLMQKLNARNPMDLIRIALEHFLLKR
ncbi:MAG: response regulator [Syntrophothermus sp.]